MRRIQCGCYLGPSSVERVQKERERCGVRALDRPFEAAALPQTPKLADLQEVRTRLEKSTFRPSLAAHWTTVVSLHIRLPY